eukprot:CAMPEP_0196585584 /NCGR_PEP_ID=MMETSP1081-20130531/51207_1 /TAXON_ID=36882 /ORGANISM="Pyramimonas amylifera, Strain CCMP720" /LENGTH=592 /DNA_ID=CAMNT_0041907181 /DNA_START=167 /DNA_END=1945 /DNA_ORIENTATION=-
MKPLASMHIPPTRSHYCLASSKPSHARTPYLKSHFSTCCSAKASTPQVALLTSRSPPLGASTCTLYARGSSLHSVKALPADSTEADSSPRVIVFSTSSCPHCQRAKGLLGSEGVIFQELDVGGRLTLLGKIKDNSGRRTVPQIYLGGKCIGGADELEALVAEGRLGSMLAGAGDMDPLPEDLRAEVDMAPTEASSSVGSLVTPEAEGAEALFLAQLVDEVRASVGAGGLIQDRLGARAFGLPWKKEKRCFSGHGLVSWLVERVEGADRLEAAGLAVRMQELWLLKHVTNSAGFADDKDIYFRFQEDDPEAPLNMRRVWRGAVRPAAEVGESLRSEIESLYSHFLSADGREVDYQSLMASPDFETFVQATGELQRVDLFQMSREELMAFFINVYNILVVHATCDIGAPGSLIERLGFFGAIKYHIGGHTYSADDIEHGILRGNRPSAADPYVLLEHPKFGTPTFSAQDPRRYHAVNPMDPRIHFALVCGAKSCPPIRIYSAQALDQGLDAAAEAFCEGEVEVDMETRTITMSKIFMWYAMDFGTETNDVLRWIIPYLTNKEKIFNLQRLLDKEEEEGEFFVKYRDYNWGINSN